ncbi:MAG: enoyl-CoA hydratase/isomerase family protein [Dehalococcoidia bacterium]|nr:enoyl-CoA hydratase/isomerase family protein [Dehalococcoidia bacterium]
MTLTDSPTAGVTRITLSRPEVLNAIDWETLAQLEDAIDQIASDDDCRVVVVAGSGERAFCAGADLNVLRDLDDDGLHRWTIAGQRILGKLGRLPQATLAVIQGYCLGGGLELALTCDLRLAADESQFGFPEITNGWIPGWGGMRLLPQAIGRGRAVAMLLLGDRIGAAEAWKSGLILEPHRPEELETRAIAMAERLAALKPRAVALLKSALLQEPLDAAGTAAAFESLALRSLLSNDPWKEDVESSEGGS